MHEGHLIVDKLALSLVPAVGDPPLRPVVHGGEVRLLDAGFVEIVRVVVGERIVLPQLTLELRSCRLIAGGMELVLRAKRPPLDQTVTTRVALTPAGNGDLRATVTYMRVGIFAASWLLDFLLSAMPQLPGIRKSGPKSLDIDLAGVLRARDVPVDLRAGVRWVEATDGMLVLGFAE